MIKKPITYTDFNGNEITENFFFNLTKAEAIELEVSRDGGLSKAIERIAAAKSQYEIIQEFKYLIGAAYGEKSPDGSKFHKSAELSAAFMATEAYSTLFMELSTDTQAGIDFVNGLGHKLDDISVLAKQVTSVQKDCADRNQIPNPTLAPAPVQTPPASPFGEAATPTVINVSNTQPSTPTQEQIAAYLASQNNGQTPNAQSAIQ